MLPRALVIMDEFQVLFNEEDRLAREAGRLLADIAKRGAAFGLHLLLATQSPGGSLRHLRPAYEQMALRIALGCLQPSVSQAILGEGNDAATRLTRAGRRDLQRPPRRGRQPGHADRDAADQGPAGADLDDPGARRRPRLPAAGHLRPGRAR